MSARSTSKIFIVRTYSNEIAPGRTYRRRSRVLSRTIVRRTDSRSVGLRQMIDAVMIVIRFAKKLARGWWRHKTSIDVESAPASDDEVSMSIERCGFADTKAKVVVSHNATQTDRQRDRAAAWRRGVVTPVGCRCPGVCQSVTAAAAAAAQRTSITSASWCDCDQMTKFHVHWASI